MRAGFHSMTVDRFKGKNHQGFTLIEIMVSMVILGLVMVTLFKLQSSTVGLAGAGKFHSVAPWLARQQLAVLSQDMGGQDSGSGSFDDSFEGYEWAWQVEPAQFDGSVIGLEHLAEQFKRIHLQIVGPNKERQYEITTYRYLVENEKIGL